MALITPEFLQTKKYRAIRDRLALAHGGSIQAGVWAAGDFKVTQRAGSANMSVDVAAGSALVNANDPGNLGLYHVQNDATVNVPFLPSDGNPRIDQVVLTVNDSTDGGDASDTPVLQVIKGTAISGVTLDAPGASKGAIPNSSLLLADVLVPANSDATGVVTANIRDRRPWSRGAFRILNPQTTTNYSTTSTTYTAISTADLQARIECSGAPIVIRFTANWQQSGEFDVIYVTLGVDGTAVANGAQTLRPALGQANSDEVSMIEWTITPTPGSHLIAPFWRVNANTGTCQKGSGTSPVLVIEEAVRQNADNS